jgi:hypothetical protein
MGMGITFFGLDGEMSDAAISDGGRLIQIGVTPHFNLDGSEAIGNETFSALLNPGRMGWSRRAEAVHGFTRAQIKAAKPAAIVDEELESWLLSHGADLDNREDTIILGFNVGSFDLPHVSLVLPRSAALLSRRTIDLNALCFTLEGFPYYPDPNPIGWHTWKTLATRYANRTIATLTEGSVLAAHDAGYDALLHLHVWRFLRAAMRGTPLPMPKNIIPVPESQIMALSLMQAYGADKAAEISGVPRDFILGWSQNGHATRKILLNRMRKAYNALPDKDKLT